MHIHDIWISGGHDFRGRHGLGRQNHGLTRLDEAECRADQGIVGDRYYGESPGGKTQVTFIAREVVENMQEALALPPVDCSTLRRNILVTGLDLNTLIGQRFRLGDVLFEGVEECKPCYWMDEAVAPGANAFLVGRGGLRCRIVEGGILRCGEAAMTIEQDVRSYDAVKQEGGMNTDVREDLTVEIPLQIMVNGRAFSMTMQTPGAERYLVRGLLHAERVCASPFLAYGLSATELGIVANVTIEGGKRVESNRRLASTAACGMCGKQSMRKIFEGVDPVTRHVTVTAQTLQTAHANMRTRQRTFRDTGGSHAAGAATAAGEVLCSFEDVGRHNAVDKVVGFLLEKEILGQADILTVSGRVSFEIVQKCARAGIPVLSAISAPSSLAVEMAESWGVTLAAFCREDRATFYSRLDRVAGGGKNR